MNKYVIHLMSMFLFILAALVVPHSMMASTVGNCQPGGFPTISAAVAAATPGAIVKVCPGTYPEQVVIATSLTLEGIQSGNTDRAVITVPGSGFPTTVTTAVIGSTVTPQVLVTVPGVNISNITVDGTGASISTNYLVGIFYQSGASGIVKEVTTRNQTSGNGVGIWAENGNPNSESVTIENSSVHDVNFFGIFVASNQTPPSLTATILKNDVMAGLVNIYNYNANASITSNVTTGGNYGATMIQNSVGSITSNTISNAFYGIKDSAQTSSSIKSNLLFNSTSSGIFLFNTINATIELNTITKAPIGIEFSCSPGPNTVKSNNISDVSTGLDQVPVSVGPLVNVYNNVDTIRTGGCGFARTAAPPSPLLP